MIQVQEFADRCAVDLPSIPAPLLNRLIVDIGRELCRVGRLWRYVIEIDADGAETYPLTLPSQYALIHDIDVVTIDDKPIDPISRSSSRIPTTTRWMRQDNEIRLTPVGMTGALAVSTILIPVPTSRELPDLLFNEWVEVVQYGVNAKALAMPNKPWSEGRVQGQVRATYSSAWNLQQYQDALGNLRSYGRGGGVTQRRRTIDGFTS